MKQIVGDILEVKSGYICHQVSCQGTLTAGSSLRLAERYPAAKNQLRVFCEDYKQSPKLLMGEVLYAGVYNAAASNYVTIAFLFGQLRWGKHERLTDYASLKKGFQHIDQISKITNLPIYVPYKIGCNNAGGSWPVVQEIIEQHCPQAIIVKPKR